MNSQATCLPGGHWYLISWFRRQEGAAQGSQGRRADQGKGAWYDHATVVQAPSNPDILCQCWRAKHLHLGVTGTASNCPWGFCPPWGASRKGAVWRGTEKAGGFCPSTLTTLCPCQETSQPGQTHCLLSLIAALSLSQSGNWPFPSIALSLPTAQLPWGSQLFLSGLQPSSATLALSYPSHLRVICSPFPLLFNQIFLFLATTLLCSLISSFAQKSKKQWGCTVELPAPEASIHPLHLVVCVVGLQRSWFCLPGGDERAQSPAGQWQHCAGESSSVWLSLWSTAAEHREGEWCPSAPLHAPHWAKSGRRWRH